MPPALFTSPEGLFSSNFHGKLRCSTVSGEKSGHVIFAGAFAARVESRPRVALNGNNVYAFCLLGSVRYWVCGLFTYLPITN